MPFFLPFRRGRGGRGVGKSETGGGGVFAQWFNEGVIVSSGGLQRMGGG